ncbi:MAG: ATP-binding protein, partial [bacterium]
KSSSISAVVTSIVLAYPEKTFNIAKILFKTKRFFFYDTRRLVIDQGQKSSLLMLKDSFGLNTKNEIYEDERLKACDDKHRKWTLEHLFLSYQSFRSAEISQDEAEKRQKVLWEILDNYYKELSTKSEETESDKTWRLYLVRMDRRKMHPTTEKTDEGFLINWNPEIESELKEYSEKALEKSSKPMKYTPLKLWACYRMKNDEQYKQYVQYENNPQLALKEAQEIVNQLGKTEDKSLHLFNYSIPADVCSVLIRDYFEKLSLEERGCCKDIILEYAQYPLSTDYKYQISDGSTSTISMLPVILEKYPEEKENVKGILLLTLFNEYPINMAGNPFNIFSIMAIQKLWEDNFNDAQSLLFGYLLLKPKYEELWKKLREENLKKNIYEVHENKIQGKFLEENKSELKNIIENKISVDNLKNIEQLDLNILNTAFQIIPLKTNNEEHKKIAQSIISAFTKTLLSRKREDRIDYTVRHTFLEKLAYFVLSSPTQDIPNYLKPIIDNFNSSEAMPDLFQEFILAEDRLDTYDKFWQVWNLFYNKIVELCKKGDEYWYTKEIIISYLFARIPWKETSMDWHAFKDNDKQFFGEIAKSIGHCSSVLYAIPKLLNNIGSQYLDTGISWLSEILNSNKKLWNDKLEINTIYYLENITRKYIYKNREKIRRTKKLKQEVLIILDFLVDKGSVIGYILRENIL